ncbi:MAG: glycosyltransferase family 4 protein [Nitrososphaera sp.]
MRILYFSQLFYPAIFGGGEYIFYHWARELARQGHEIFVIAQKLKGSPASETFDGIKIWRVGSELDLSRPLPIGIGSSISFILASLSRGLEICRKNRIDVIHSNTYIPVISAQMCASMSGVPHVATVHDVYYTSKKGFWKEWSNQSGATGSMKTLGPLMEKIVCKMPVTKFHTVSQVSKSDMQALGIPEKKIEVIPNGVDPSSYETRAAVNRHQAAYVGRLVFYKNIGTIIDAFGKVLESIPDATLIIAGDGPEKSSFTKKAEKLGRHMIFRGNISEEEKVRLLSESAVLLNPSTIEGFGIVVLEGFACGRPVLVSNVEPLSDLVNDHVDGFVVSAKDSGEWASKIIDLMLDPEKAERMGRAGRQKVEAEYSLSAIARRLVQMYSTLR